jgi:hypothetical protein
MRDLFNFRRPSIARLSASAACRLERPSDSHGLSHRKSAAFSLFGYSAANAGYSLKIGKGIAKRQNARAQVFHRSWRQRSTSASPDIVWQGAIMGSRQPFGATLSTGLLVLLLSSVSALPQSRICALTQDKRNPSERILRSGQELTITPAAGTVYRPDPGSNGALPTSVQLNSGALLIEFKPNRRRE